MPPILISPADTTVWQGGDATKPNPLFILILNNPALESPENSGSFMPDLPGDDPGHRPLFDASARYIVDSLFGRLPGQAEKLLSDSPDAASIKVWSVFVPGLPPEAGNALVADYLIPGSSILAPRRDAVVDFLRRMDLDPDIVFVVSNSPTNRRAAAYGTTDDDSRGGVDFSYDGRTMSHRFFHLVPGMAAMHTTSSGLTAAHEFGHAFSSYSNGFVTDLYVSGDEQFNRKTGRPIPAEFCRYNAMAFASDPLRNGLGYPGDWTSYHPELADPANPSVMDNFWWGQDNGMACRHDKLTKAYILDRIAAKVSR